MATTIKAQLVSMELDSETRRRKIHDATGVCEINGTPRGFQLREVYHYGDDSNEFKITIDGIDFESLKAIDTIIDFANLVVRYQELKAEEEIKKAEAARIGFGENYDKHCFHKFVKENKGWKINFTREEYVAEKETRTCGGQILRLTRTVGSAEYKIKMNDRGQFELDVNYNTIKRSKFSKEIIKALDNHVESIKSNKRIADTEKTRRTEVHSEIKADLGKDVEAISERKSSGHGRSYHSYDKKSFQIVLQKAKEDYNTKRITFTRTRDGNYSIDWFKVGDLSSDKMKKLIELMKED